MWGEIFWSRSHVWQPRVAEKGSEPDDSLPSKPWQAVIQPAVECTPVGCATTTT